MGRAFSTSDAVLSVEMRNSNGNAFMHTASRTGYLKCFRKPMIGSKVLKARGFIGVDHRHLHFDSVCRHRAGVLCLFVHPGVRPKVGCCFEAILYRAKHFEFLLTTASTVLAPVLITASRARA